VPYLVMVRHFIGYCGVNDMFYQNDKIMFDIADLVTL